MSAPLHIGLDLHTYSPDSGSGVSVYMEELTRAMAALDAPERFTVLAHGMRRRVGADLLARFPFLAGDDGWELGMARIPSRIPRLVFDSLWFGWHLPRQAARRGFDVLLCPDFYAPATCPCPCVTVVHDVSVLVEPHWLDTRRLPGFHRRLAIALENSRRIVTVSENSRLEIQRRFGLGAERVRAVPHAPRRPFRPLDDLTPAHAAARRQGLERDFVLYVGTLQPRKNVEGLLDAYEMVRGRHDILLAIAGRAGWKTDRIDRKRAQSLYRGDIRFLGFVPDQEAALLMNAARLFVYPSFFEGFGMPVVEAMACGTPVVTSNCSALPEVAGDAALLADPSAPEEIAAAMLRILEDEGEARRLRAAGLARAACFSWTRSARITLEILREAAREC